MKMTLDLRDDLLARAKELAAKGRTFLTKIFGKCLAVRLRRHRALRGKPKELRGSARGN